MNKIDLKKVATVQDLLLLQDEDFLYMAYRLLLGRSPDSAGFAHYLKQIRAGRDKAHIVYQIITSPEGKNRSIDLTGLSKELRKVRLGAIPFLGTYIYRILTGGYTGQKLRSLENMLYVQEKMLVNQYRLIDDRLESIKNIFSKSVEELRTIDAVTASSSSSNANIPIDDTAPTGVFSPRNHFDNAYYLKMNPDVARAEIDPYRHFVEHGSAEGRPARYFDGPRYICEYPDIAHSGIDPYRHFLLHGMAEGRVGKYFDPNRYKALNPELSVFAADLYERYVEQWQPDGHSHVAWEPSSRLVFSAENGYAFAEDCASYTYISPAKPSEFDLVVRAFAQRPTFSLLVPVYNTPTGLLEKLYKSVLAQWYIDWELIFINDSSNAFDIPARLTAFEDPRVKTIKTSSNMGIAGATNQGLKAATGEFIVLLDHDDEITPDCLFELAICINKYNPDYIYSDEDKIDQSGRYVEPHFKPDWSPDTMMSTMYVCHVSCIRSTILRDIGGLQSRYDGCQDWDLVLRLTEKTQRIRHIPKVLYHWRIIPQSIAADIAAKPYVLESSRKVREDALLRRGIAGAVEPLPYMQGYFRVNYFPRNSPFISIIIPTRDNSVVLRQCVESIFAKSTYPNFEIIVIDNGSVKEETHQYLSTIGSRANVFAVRCDIPFNFSKLNNVGVARSRGDVLIFLNDDTQVISADWMERLAGYAQLSHIGAVGAKLLYPDNTVQHAGVLNLSNGPGHAFLKLGAHDPGYFMRNLLEYNWIAVTGACLAIERDKFINVGGFDETFPIAYNDVDLCFSLIRSGYWNVVCQAVELYHYESISRGVDHTDPKKLERLNEEKRRLYLKHDEFFMNDPFYSQNLHPNSAYFDMI